MSRAARVFVGVPTLNRPDYVRETVQSVLSQSFGDIRVVVSDNRSTPEVVSSVKAFLAELRDPRVSFHEQPTDVGEFGQGWYFFREAREEFFVILHDDDTLEPDYLAKAIATLESRPHVAFFLANPFVMDWQGELQLELTREYLAEHGRTRRPAGEFDLLAGLFDPGTAWLSGTCFRLAALRDSGFADDDCAGHYLEFNVFLRLAERHCKGWFEPEQLMGLRFHRESLRVYCGWNPQIVANTTRLLERRRFEGRPERQRRAMLGFLYRAAGLQALDVGDSRAARAAFIKALKAYPWSPGAWRTAGLGLLAPRLLQRLKPLTETRLAATTAGAREGVVQTTPQVTRGGSTA